MQVEELQTCLTTLVKAWAQSSSQVNSGNCATTVVFNPQMDLPSQKDRKEEWEKGTKVTIVSLFALGHKRKE